MSKENTTGVVMVGCKLPHGLLLELKRPGGEVERVTIKGANDSRIVGGYGITEGVSEEFWNAWLKRYPRFPAVLSGALFIHNDQKSAEAIAKERRDIVSGFEAIDPLKNGMLKGPDGQVDEEAAKVYRQSMSENPDRNRQRVE